MSKDRDLTDYIVLTLPAWFLGMLAAIVLMWLGVDDYLAMVFSGPIMLALYVIMLATDNR